MLGISNWKGGESMGIEEAALTNMHMDADAVSRCNELFEKLRDTLLEENPTYREAKVAIYRLDKFLRLETGAYISKLPLSNMHPIQKS